MTPEEKARIQIDQMLEAVGWKVVNRDEITVGMQALAVREGLLEGNLEADYLLFVGNRAVGVLEAKRVEIDVTSPVVTQQALNYSHKVPDWCQTWHTPLPIVYVSNGKDTYLYDFFHFFPDEGEWQKADTIMSPKQVVEVLRQQGISVEGDFVKLPALRPRGLRQCQFDAVNNIELSFIAGKQRALVVLATGAGKTYTACLTAYRMLSYTPAKRVLFLVDRNNLGKQAADEFGTFRLTETGDSFSSIFGVERMKSAQFDQDSNVIISTIQRLFSVLTGQNLIDTDDNEEDDDFDTNDEDDQTVITLNSQELKLAPDTFDLIIIDECHRSIYSKWRKVLEYFSKARFVGLTATPSELTLPFFNNNLVSRYSLEQSIADGVNVPCRIYSIDTLVTREGGIIHKGDTVDVTTRYTGNESRNEAKEDIEFHATDVNRDIVVPAQIDLIIRSFHDCIYRDLYPQRAEADPDMRYIPKTLIYALNDQHATRIVESVRRHFPGQDERFVQKITYSAGDSNALIRSFRNDKEFRIAVTVTLVATGTDVKPLEIVMFMRDVSSELLYVQMKGRGVRTIGDDQLRTVTPNADTKDLFYLVDAAGVTKHDHIIPPGTTTPPPPHMTLEQLIERIIMGDYGDEALDDLAGRISRIHNRTREPKRAEFEQLAHISLHDFALAIYTAIGVMDAPAMDEAGRKQLLMPITANVEAKQKLLELNRGYTHTLNPGEDQLIYQGFSTEEAKTTTEAFEKYIREHADEQEALRILFNQTGEPLTYEMLTELIEHLRCANVMFRPNQLWNFYSLLRPGVVRPLNIRSEREAITNIICLVRYALHQIDHLQSYTATGSKLFALWCGQMQRSLTDEQKSLMGEILEYIIHNGTCLFDADYKQQHQTLSMQLIQSFHTAKAAQEAILSLSSFILNNVA